MADLKKLALGRKGIKAAPAKDVKPAKTLEQSSAEEVDEVAQAFRGRITKEDKRRRTATDSEFWIAVCFGSREEKERFLRKYGLDRVGDKYLPGNAVDRVLDRRNTAERVPFYYSGGQTAGRKMCLYPDLNRARRAI